MCEAQWSATAAMMREVYMRMCNQPWTSLHTYSMRI